jgi:hypothetical protein
MKRFLTRKRRGFGMTMILSLFAGDLERGSSAAAVTVWEEWNP